MQHERTAILQCWCRYEAPLLTGTASQFACHVYAPRIEFSAQPSLIYCINVGGSLCVHALDSDTTPACAQAGSLLVVGEELCALITADTACGGAAY